VSRYFYGFERADGSVGTRNKVLVLPTVICVNEVASKVSSMVRGTVCALHTCGCTQLGEDFEQTYRTLLGTALNPNVYSVLIIGLGCEKVDAGRLADDIAKAGKWVEVVTVQELGYEGSISKGVEILGRMVNEASKLRRSSYDVSNLTVGLECGGSDATSAISANPVVGYVTDKLIDFGATVIFAETPEVIGAEHILLTRMMSDDLRGKFLRYVKWFEDEMLKAGVDIRGTNPTPGNIRGGISTLEEKSLGAVIKSGSKPIAGVVDYGEKPHSKGLIFMNTPGYDVESVTGLVAGGSQVIIFTTGRGTPVGSPVAPVIKVTGNPHTYRKLASIFDVYVGTVVEGLESIEGAGERLLNELLNVASGKLTASEVLNHNEYSIWRLGTSF